MPDIEVSTNGVPIGSPDDGPLNRAVAMLQQSAQAPRPAPRIGLVPALAAR
jgi:hypothetical protein